MNILVEQMSGEKPVAILKIQGELDGKSYLDLVRQAQQIYAAGTRHLLLDLSEMTFMSSAGLVGLHTVILIMRGYQPREDEDGWGALHDIDREVTLTTHFDPYCKLLQPQPRIQKTLEITGFSQVLEIFNDRKTALNSF